MKIFHGILMLGVFQSLYGDNGIIDGAVLKRPFYEDSVQITRNQMKDHLNHPIGIAFSEWGHVVIANSGSDKITAFDPSGKLDPKFPSVTVSGHPIGIRHLPPDSLVLGDKHDEFWSPEYVGCTIGGGIFAFSQGMTKAYKIIGEDKKNPKHLRGIAVAQVDDETRVYLANFSEANKHKQILVYQNTLEDGKLVPIDLGKDAFVDKTIPKEFSPSAIAVFGDLIGITYAFRSEKGELVRGHGGFANLWDLNGRLVMQIKDPNFLLNAPGAITLAAPGIFRFGQRILIGNLADGLIHAFSLVSGEYRGTLYREDNSPLSIKILGALEVSNCENRELYWTAFGDCGSIWGKIRRRHLEPQMPQKDNFDDEDDE